jgi:hypothetical protein
MLCAVKQFQRFRDVRHVHLQAQIGGALPEGLTSGMPRSQASASEPVHGLAEADVLLAAEPLGRGRHVVIEPDRRAHKSKRSISDASSAHHRITPLGRVRPGLLACRDYGDLAPRSKA